MKSEVILCFLPYCFLHDSHKSLRVETRGSDEESVDFAPAYEFVCTCLGCAPAVDDPTFRLSEDGADEGMNFLDGRRGRGFSGTDRPDGFIGNINSRRIPDSEKPFRELNFENFFRESGFLLGKILADAENRSDIMCESRPHFFIHELVGFSENRPTLGMPEDDVLTPKLLNQERRSLARVSTGIFVVHILRPEMDAGTTNEFRCECETGGNRCDHKIDRPETRVFGDKDFKILTELRRRLIHLEIRTDKEIHTPYL